MKVLQISAGNSHSAAILFDGSIKVWGGNRMGQTTFYKKEKDGIQLRTPKSLPFFKTRKGYKSTFVTCEGPLTLWVGSDGKVQGYGRLGSRWVVSQTVKDEVGSNWMEENDDFFSLEFEKSLENAKVEKLHVGMGYIIAKLL